MTPLRPRAGVEIALPCMNRRPSGLRQHRELSNRMCRSVVLKDLAAPAVLVDHLHRRRTRSRGHRPQKRAHPTSLTADCNPRSSRFILLTSGGIANDREFSLRWTKDTSKPPHVGRVPIGDFAPAAESAASILAPYAYSMTVMPGARGDADVLCARLERGAGHRAPSYLELARGESKASCTRWNQRPMLFASMSRRTAKLSPAQTDVPRRHT